MSGIAFNAFNSASLGAPFSASWLGGFSVPIPIGGNPLSSTAWQRFSLSEISRNAASSFLSSWRDVKGATIRAGESISTAFAGKEDVVAMAISVFSMQQPELGALHSIPVAFGAFLNPFRSPSPSSFTAEDPFKEELSLLWKVDPTIKTIFDVDDIEEARGNLQSYVELVEAALPDRIHPMELEIVQRAAGVLRDISSKRNEDRCGGSSIEWLILLARDPESASKAGISAGFVAEIRHLFIALLGKSRIYDNSGEPKFLSKSGREAALERSDDLDAVAAQSRKWISRYRSGIDDEILEMRAKNVRRIKGALGATDFQWDDWRWQLQNVIRDGESLQKVVALSESELEAVRQAEQLRLPFGITPYYASLMNPDGRSDIDSAIRAQVLPSLYYVDQVRMAKRGAGHGLDFMREGDTSPIDLVSRRYPNIAIFKPYNTCAQICVYCQRNWEIDGVLSPNALASEAKIDAAIAWFAAHPGVTEVLITGGDPFLLSDEVIEGFLKRFASMPHIERIRFGTRTPVVLPQRITPELGEMLSYYSKPGRREVAVVTHFEHASEVTPEAIAAVQNLRKSGLSVYNQMVFTFENSRRFEAVATRRAVRLAGIDPYYTFVAKGKEETRDFRVPTARLLQEQKEESRLVPGLARTDEAVFNVPRLGKNHLRAAQHHRLVAFRKDGSRVIEFHPWEKNLTKTTTYLSEDPPIYDYLAALAARGEDPAKYESIWYYY